MSARGRTGRHGGTYSEPAHREARRTPRVKRMIHAAYHFGTPSIVICREYKITDAQLQAILDEIDRENGARP